MLHVRTVPSAAVGGALPLARSPSGRGLRLAALGLLGLAIGAGGAVLAVSTVQAENDAGIRSFFLEDAARREAAPRNGAYASSSSSAYAPAGRPWHQRLFETRPDGRLSQPPLQLEHEPRAERSEGRKKKRSATVSIDKVSGAANVARTYCVRLCDGFHAPLGHLRSNSDLRGHEALCQAMNPGIPVRVFKLAAGADTLDDATSQDGRRYSALPVARAHETSADPACRPAIPAAGERRVSLLRDFTLRPGDSVVLDGKVRTFGGGRQFPYSPRDFEDFRASSELTGNQRRQIDEQVGISRGEAQMTSLRRQMRLREASLRADSASDAVLRGAIEPQERDAVRIIPLGP